MGASAPVVIASVTDTMVSRGYFGGYPAFIISSRDVASFLEFLAFALLGVISGTVAIVFMKSVIGVLSAMECSMVPIWLQPAIGGLIVRLIAIAFPQLLGIRYAATDDAVRTSRP